MGKFLSLVLLCILSAFAFSQSIDLISPQDGFTTGNKEVSFEFYYNATDSDYDLAMCTLIIDGSLYSMLSSAQVPAFTSFAFSSAPLPPGQHSWEVFCDQQNSTTGDTLENSLYAGPRTFEILPIEATLELNSPQNNFQTQSRQITFSFTYSAHDTGPQNPTCYLESGVSRLAQTTAPNGDQTQIQAELPYGTHAWRIRCVQGSFEIFSPIYSIDVFAPPTPSGGGSVGTPYKRNITPPAPITGPLTGPISDTLNSDSIVSNIDGQFRPKSEQTKTFEKAILTAPQNSFEGERILLRALTPFGQPIANAQIHIIDPQNEIIYLLSDSQGEAFFTSSTSGLYMYKMPDYELPSLPVTHVSANQIPKKETTQELSEVKKEQNSLPAPEPKSESDSAWLFWGAISVAFILASFFVLSRFSQGDE